MARIEEQNALLGLELLDPVEDAAQFQSAQNGRVPKEALLSEIWSIGKEEQGDCAVCLSSLYTERVVKTTCNHSYHLLCLENWLVAKHTCPICRAVITWRRTG